MTGEERFFLTVLRDHLQGVPTAKQEPLDTERLYEMAVSQQMVSVFYEQCKGFLPETVAKKCRGAEAMALYAYVNRRSVLKRLGERFRAADISFFSLKGPFIAPFYPKPHLRTMGDIDIVVSEKRDAAHEVMLEEGFTLLEKTVTFEWTYQKHELVFELHPKLVYDEASNTETLTNYFNGFADYVGEDGTLDRNFHFLFILFHLRKHLMNCGVGIRMFFDIAATIKNGADFDFPWMEAELEKLNLLPFAKKVMACCERWFDVPSPFGGDEADEAFLEAAAQRIFADGVFGQDNEDNVNSSAANRARNVRFPLLSMMGHTLRRIFPGYRTLCRSRHYTYVKGKPYLVPVAWICRLFYGVFHKGKFGVDYLLAENFVSGDAVRARREWYEQWGL